MRFILFIKENGRYTYNQYLFFTFQMKEAMYTSSLISISQYKFCFSALKDLNIRVAIIDIIVVDIIEMIIFSAIFSCSITNEGRIATSVLN